MYCNDFASTPDEPRVVKREIPACSWNSKCIQRRRIVRVRFRCMSRDYRWLIVPGYTSWRPSFLRVLPRRLPISQFLFHDNLQIRRGQEENRNHSIAYRLSNFRHERYTKEISEKKSQPACWRQIKCPWASSCSFILFEVMTRACFSLSKS